MYRIVKGAGDDYYRYYIQELRYSKFWGRRLWKLVRRVHSIEDAESLIKYWTEKLPINFNAQGERIDD